ncbi:MAG: PHP domain-containing protein [Oscillospiraceae bacterium]|nr:PHP domain-containing protein [Oscillospiraceae bacterium]
MKKHEKGSVLVNDYVKIDLHLHSNVSDGTDSPVELLSRVKEAGIEVFSLTDHDAIKGCEQIAAALKAADAATPSFVTGVEFSCKDELGKYHILGYGYNPAGETIRAVVERGHALRMKKTRERLSFIQREYGFAFPQEELDAILSMDNPGKPHIGNLMVKHGYAATKKEAIREYIDKLRLGNAYVRPEEAIEGILGAGGIPVLAHPCFGDGDQLIVGEELEARLRRLMEMGLQGMECYYSGFSPKLRGQMLALAEKHSLYITAGSDYHGSNKLVTMGDTGMSAAAPLPSGLQRFIDTIYRKEETQ